jgi:hypothetical protein
VSSRKPRRHFSGSHSTSASTRMAKPDVVTPTPPEAPPQSGPQPVLAAHVNEATPATRFMLSTVTAASILPAKLASALGLKRQVVVGTAELALHRYTRSRWLPACIALVLVLFLVCFRYPFGAPYFYDIATFGMVAITIVTTYALVHWILSPMAYLRTGLRTSLRSMFAGLALASATISTSLILLLLFLALITRRFAETMPGPLIAGTIGLLANCILVGTLTVTLSTPATAKTMRFAFLVWLVVALSSYDADGLLMVLLWPARLLLLPFAACYNFGVTGTIDFRGLLALLAEAAAVAGLVWFSEANLRSRLHSPGL